MLDLPSLLQPVTASAPAGPDVRSRSDYQEFERASAGTPERTSGTTILPAEPPDWNVVIDRATALLKESKDLGVAIQLVHALLQTRSFAGYAEGVALVRQLIDSFWDGLHPVLDAEDNNDPTARVNKMRALVHRDTVLALRVAPLIKSKVFGSVSVRDLEQVAGRKGEDAAGAAAAVEAAFREVNLDELSAAADAVERSNKETADLMQTWSRRLGPGASGDSLVNFSDLRKVLAQADKAMKEKLAQRMPTAAGGAPSTDGEVTHATAAAFSPRGELRTREDVVKALDGICAYYARHEPSSPVPLLIERCKRLVSMSFLEIVKDMVPDGLSTLQTIAGKQDDAR
jgi:type VI secretion system protein ImpA